MPTESETPIVPPPHAIVGKPSDAELDSRFRFRGNPTPERIAAHDDVTESCLALAKHLRDICPPGRNLAIVLTKLEDVRMRANMAIACGQ